MSTFQAEFDAINSDADLEAFATRYGFVRQETSKATLYNLSYQDETVAMRHRYWDPSGPFQNLPDENEIKIEWRAPDGTLRWSSSRRYTG
jgi:hypothetical protein